MDTKTKTNYPSPKEMIKLREKWLKGDKKAYDEAIVGNLGLVMKIAGQIFPFNSPEWKDAVQEGSIGLIRGFDRWIPEKGKFGTFVAYWIKQAITSSGYNKARMIRIPVHAQEAKKKLQTVVNIMEEDLKRLPTLAEISEELGISEDHIQKLLSQPSQTASLDAPTFMNSEGEYSHYDFVEDENTRSPHQIALLKDECLLAAKIMRDLREYLGERTKGGVAGKNCLIFFSRYGIFGYGPAKTLEETAKPYKITRERVRQICAKIFKQRAKLRLIPYSDNSLEALLESITTGVEIMVSMDEEVPEEVLSVIRNH